MGISWNPAWVTTMIAHALQVERLQPVLDWLCDNHPEALERYVVGLTGRHLKFPEICWDMKVLFGNNGYSQDTISSDAKECLLEASREYQAFQSQYDEPPGKTDIGKGAL